MTTTVTAVSETTGSAGATAFAAFARRALSEGAHAVVGRAVLAPDEMRGPEPPALLELVAAVGNPIAFADEFDGAFVHDIRPRAEMRDAQVSSTTGNLNPHTEDAYHPISPDLLVLGCVEGGPTPVPTRLTPFDPTSEPLAWVLDDPDLGSPLFRFEYCYLTPLRGQFSRPFAVLDDTGARRRLRVNQLGATLCASERAQAALRRLLATPIPPLDVFLTPGDVLVVDNARTIHGRPPMDASFDDGDRWLRRCYATLAPVEPSAVSAVAPDHAGQVVAPLTDLLGRIPVPRPAADLRPGELVVAPDLFTPETAACGLVLTTPA